MLGDYKMALKIIDDFLKNMEVNAAYFLLNLKRL